MTIAPGVEHHIVSMMNVEFVTRTAMMAVIAMAGDRSVETMAIVVGHASRVRETASPMTAVNPYKDVASSLNA